MRSGGRSFASSLGTFLNETAAAARHVGVGLLSFIVSMVWPFWPLWTGRDRTCPKPCCSPGCWRGCCPRWWLLVSRPLPDRVPQLSQGSRELRRMAPSFAESSSPKRSGFHDNFQEEPKGVVAHRTSPTNKGLLLLPTLSAHDLGYITLTEMAVRIRRTFDTFDRLERFHGHSLNWYETTTLQPLHPAYVSTVDSGNLLACLLALRNGLQAKLGEPLPSSALVDGLLDTRRLAEENISKDTSHGLRKHIEPRLRSSRLSLTAWDEWLTRAEEAQLAVPGMERIACSTSSSRAFRLADVCPGSNAAAVSSASGPVPPPQCVANLCDGSGTLSFIRGPSSCLCFRRSLQARRKEANSGLKRQQVFLLAVSRSTLSSSFLRLGAGTSSRGCRYDGLPLPAMSRAASSPSATTSHSNDWIVLTTTCSPRSSNHQLPHRRQSCHKALVPA